MPKNWLCVKVRVGTCGTHLILKLSDTLTLNDLSEYLSERFRL